MACKKADCISKRIMIITILLVISVLLIFVEKIEKNPSITKIYKNIIDSTLISKIDSVVIIQKLQNRTIQFAKKKDGWIVVNKDYKVDKYDWQDFLNRLKELRKEELVSIKKEKFKDFHLDSAHYINVKCFVKGKEVYDLYFGKSAPGSSSLYFNNGKDTKVYLTTGIARYILERDPSLWIDRKPYSFAEKEIRNIDFFSKDSNCAIFVANNDSSFTVIYNDQKISPVDSNNTLNWLRKINEIRISDIYPVNDSLLIRLEKTENKIIVTTKFDSLAIKYIDNPYDKNKISYILYDNKNKKFFRISRYNINNFVRKKDYFIKKSK